MATIDRRRGKWRAQVRRRGHGLIKTFAVRSDAELWAREIERAIDMDIDPSARRLSTKEEG
jgi:hypothetical protein